MLNKYKLPETYNFDEEDDACLWGTHEIFLETTDVGLIGTMHQQLRTYVKFPLHTVEGGKLQGLAQITYTHTGEWNAAPGFPCSGTFGIGAQFFQADLKGEFNKMPDGSTVVSSQATPDHGEPYVVQVRSNCPSPDADGQRPGWYGGGARGALKDGVYDYYQDMASTVGADVFWQKNHMEQGRR